MDVNLTTLPSMDNLASLNVAMNPHLHMKTTPIVQWYIDMRHSYISDAVAKEYQHLRFKYGTGVSCPTPWNCTGFCKPTCIGYSSTVCLPSCMGGSCGVPAPCAAEFNDLWIFWYIILILNIIFCYLLDVCDVLYCVPSACMAFVWFEDICRAAWYDVEVYDWNVGFGWIDRLVLLYEDVPLLTAFWKCSAGNDISTTFCVYLYGIYLKSTMLWICTLIYF